MSDVWRVSMSGRLGYSCVVEISRENAKTQDEAKNIACWMFPELKFVEVEDA